MNDPQSIPISTTSPQVRSDQNALRRWQAALRKGATVSMTGGGEYKIVSTFRNIEDCLEAGAAMNALRYLAEKVAP